MSSTFRAALLTAALAATGANAAGFYFGDNGSKSLIQGGAFTGQADDLTAIMYNPAGLARMDGINFLVDAELINHNVTFSRLDPGFDVANPPASLANPVSNTGGIFFLPFIGVSYALEIADRRLTLALGVYGPPSVGRYHYPEPNYTRDAANKYVENPRKTAPQRYGLINNDVIILYPSLSAAFQVHRRFQVGVSLQLVYSKFFFRQTLYSGLTQPMRQADEDPLFDSVVNVDLNGRMGFTGILGVMGQPLDNLSIGASVRPPVPIRADGKLTIELGEAAKGLNSVVTGDQASLALTLPLEARIGAHYRPISRLGINFDFVYLGWQSVKELVLTPRDISLKVGSAEAKPVEEFHIPKNWHQSLSFRLGASFDIIKYLTVHAGFFYETGAAPDQYAGIDFLHFDRFFITGGLSAHLAAFEVVGGIAFTPTVTRAVNDSLVLAGSTDPEIMGSSIGNGVYGSGGFIATVGVRGHFGGASKQAPPSAPPPPMPARGGDFTAPAPAPAVDPTPAPAP